MQVVERDEVHYMQYRSRLCKGSSGCGLHTSYILQKAYCIWQQLWCHCLVLQVRARRRYDELVARGGRAAAATPHTVSFERILADMQSRDARDSSRAVAPLAPVADAVTLDTSMLTPAQALEEAAAVVLAACPQLQTPTK